MITESDKTRRVHPALAFLAGLVGLGLGYAYLGRARAGIGAFIGYFLLVGLFSWTRLLVLWAAVYWLLAALAFVLLGVALVHPVILAARQRSQARQWYNRAWVYALWIIGVAIAGSLFIRYRAAVFGYDTFRIPSVSMEPTVLNGDYVMADTWHYRNHLAEPGDIAIVERSESPGIKYIKRVLAVAGDTIEIRKGILYRNGLRIEEPYVHEWGAGGGYGRDLSSIHIDPGYLYVLGDYRDNSVDSRRWGPLPTSSLRGQVKYVWWSMSGTHIRWDRIGISLVY